MTTPSHLSTPTEKGGGEVLTRALQEIVDLQPVPYDFPADWNEQINGCAECARWRGHPIQQGVCDDHRRPLWDRDRHDAAEIARLGYRAKQIAREALYVASKAVR